MELKVKILYKDRVKPTDLMQFGEQDSKSEVRKKVIQKLERIVNQITDDQDPVVGLYISRE